MSVIQLDAFLERQGIKSAELCKIIDNIEKTIQSLKTQLAQVTAELEKNQNKFKQYVEGQELGIKNYMAQELELATLKEFVGLYKKIRHFKGNFSTLERSDIWHKVEAILGG